MTAKEKAHYLVHRYLHSGKLHNTKAKYMGAGQMESYYDENVEIESAKQCALIAVEEILERSHVPRKDDYYNVERQYWKEVKQEIENM